MGVKVGVALAGSILTSSLRRLACVGHEAACGAAWARATRVRVRVRVTGRVRAGGGVVSPRSAAVEAMTGVARVVAVTMAVGSVVAAEVGVARVGVAAVALMRTIPTCEAGECDTEPDRHDRDQLIRADRGGSEVVREVPRDRHLPYKEGGGGLPY